MSAPARENEPVWPPPAAVRQAGARTPSREPPLLTKGPFHATLRAWKPSGFLADLGQRGVQGGS